MERESEKGGERECRLPRKPLFNSQHLSFVPPEQERRVMENRVPPMCWTYMVESMFAVPSGLRHFSGLRMVKEQNKIIMRWGFRNSNFQQISRCTTLCKSHLIPLRLFASKVFAVQYLDISKEISSFF